MKVENLNVGDMIYRAYIWEYTMESTCRQYAVVAKFGNAGDKSVILKELPDGNYVQYSNTSMDNTERFAYSIDRANELALEELAEKILEAEKHLELQKEALQKFSYLFKK